RPPGGHYCRGGSKFGRLVWRDARRCAERRDKGFRHGLDLDLSGLAGELVPLAPQACARAGRRGCAWRGSPG
ncbi:MAG: hypothetical protein ACK55I_10615, partial [bacterium]